MSTTNHAVAYHQRLDKAITEYLGRKANTRRPSGHRDRVGNWYPADGERRDCCARTRQSTYYREQGVRAHLRGYEHIAALFDVAEQDLRNAVADAQRN